MTAECEGLAEIAGVLAEHRTACIPRIYPAWSCSCGGWDGSRDDGAQDTIEAAEAHLADALADLLAARDRRARGEAWEEGHDTCCAVYARHCSYAVNPFAEEIEQ